MARVGLEEEPDSPRPMSQEQQVVGEAQSLGAFGTADWESTGLGAPSLLDPSGA